MSKSKNTPVDPTQPSFVPVCAIGASAGGVGALQTLFRLLPDDLGLAYVVVVHLSPEHPSAMHEILAACTKMPVHQVTDGPALMANCVYVIAPDSELVIDGDNVKAQPFTDPRGKRAPIDMFFRSIAAGRGDGIAVVLTGAGSDGALGVRAIKEAGGIVMVQEPAEAGFPSMPQNAIATGVADVVAPLARLAERIADAAHSKEAVRSLDEDGAANDIRRIVAFLRTRTGHDFSGYKRSTVLRRIQRRMQVAQINGLADYAAFLRTNPEEAKELLSDLLISVTMFFRDPETFITLNQRVIRPLMESRSAGDTEGEIRAWVVGCATGEEAYSLAILLLEEADRLKVSIPIQIFATDLDEGALATAREGRYPRTIEADVSAERLKRFFIDEGTHYRIDRKVRDLILFAAHSVVREPPFMRLDLVTCRNVLIYLERSLQNQVNSIFRYGLKSDGYLFLGTAETADTSDNHFAVVDRDARIYRALPSRPDFVPALSAGPPWSPGRPALTESRLSTVRFDAGEVLGESHAAALEASAPPSALVDAEQGVLHLSPSAGRFILLSAGPLSGRLASIVRPELRLDLKLALDRAFDTYEPTITRPIDVVMEGATRRVSLHIAPLPVTEGIAPRALVYFLDSGPGQGDGDDATAPPTDELQHLHSELKVAQEAELAGRMRHESAVQELRASNEELQSLNEEYRSTAEELETSKEELQSINEELQTVNAELKSKLGIISAAHNDLQNLTASSEIGTLFLDPDLRIRMFTPRVAELINVADADIGRPITNFTHRLEYDGIARDVRGVLRDLTPIETEVRTVDGNWFLIRIRPYRTLEGKVEGAVATFDDITERKDAAEVLAEELRNTEILQKLGARLVTEENIQTIYEDILTAAIEITRAKAGTVQMLDADAEELVVIATRGFSNRTEQHFHRLDARSGTSCGLALRTGERSFFNFDPASTEVSTRLHVEDGVLSAQSSLLISRSGQPIGMVSTHWGDLDHRLSERELRFLDLLVRQAADLLEQRQADAALRESEQHFRALARTAGSTIYHMSADWRFMYQLDSDTLAPTLEPIEDWVEKYIPAEDLPAVRATIDGAIRTKSMFELEHRVRQADGSVGWVLSRAIPLLDPAGDIAEWFGTASDVTDRRTAVEHLRESEEKYRTLFTKMGQGYIEVELIRGPGGDAIDYRYVVLNPAYEQLTGIPVDKAVGRPSLEVIPDLSSFWAQTFQRIVDNQTAEEFEYEEKALDRWFGIYAYPGEGDRLTVLALDITQRKRAEAALRESEARFRTLTETAPALIWQQDANGDNLFVNRYYLDYTGLAADEIGGEKWRALIHPDDAEAYVADFMAAVHERRAVHNRCRVRRHDGAWRWCENYAQPLLDGDGRYLGHVGVSTDVTTLRESEERLTGLGDASQDILWIRDAETLAWTYLTPAFEDTYGVSMEEALQGDNFRNWLNLIVPEDRDHARSMIERVRSGEQLTFEYRIRRPQDGEIRWLRDTDFPIRDEHGRVTGFGGIGHDITVLKAAEEGLRTSEERLRSATEVAKFALWDWNITTGEIAWSDEHFRMEGYTVGEVAPSYEAWAARIHPDDRAEAEAALGRARDNHTEYVHEFRSLHPDGSIHWLSGKGRFFYDKSGEPVRMIGAMLEVTERREWEERQQVLIAELQHRTRNLIGVVRSMSDKTARASTDLTDFRERFRDRLEALSRVQGLLSRLNDVDRVTFDDLIHTELAAMDGNAERVTLDGPSGVRLRSSTVQTLALALHELATNAVKYGALKQPSGHLAITWSLEPAGNDGKPWLHIDWRETGVDMPPPGSPATGTGQGRELIERALPYQLSAKTSYILGPDGVHCTISIPVSASKTEVAEHG